MKRNWLPLVPGGGLVVRFTRTERAGSPALAVNGEGVKTQRRERDDSTETF